MLKILVLGAAAGGGYPQWNCNHDGCRRARTNDPNAKPQSQSSIAVSCDDREWYLFNASPDLRQQFFDNPQLHPKHGARHTPVGGVLLTNADVDHIAGLLTMRESQAFSLYATSRVHRVLRENSIFQVLNPKFVERREFRLNQPVELRRADGTASGIEVEPFSVPGKVALYLEDASAGENFGTQDEDTIGLRISSIHGGEHFFYIPGCAAMPDHLQSRLRGAPLVMFDGTLWENEEMITVGTGVDKTGQRMGHMSMSGADGTIAAFADLDVGRKIFIHINNTNPVLLSDSAERAALDGTGWELARDGMEVQL
jgi:pyrroloquinoline quinone biosynthesis protein B